MNNHPRLIAGLLITFWLGVYSPTPSVRSQADAAPPRQDARLEYGQTRQSELTETVTEQDWAFAGTAGDLILIDMRADGSNLDPYLTLIDPFGSPLISDDDSGEGVNARIGPVRLPNSGNYTIAAARYGGAGGYLLELKNLDTVPTIDEGKPLTGNVNSTHPTDYFLLPAGTPDDLWQVTVVDDQLRTDPYLSLYGTSGLISSTEPTSASSIDPIVTVPDSPYILVVSWNRTSSGGPYQIELTPSDMDLLDVDAAQTGTLDYLTLEQRHYFRGDEGQAVRLIIEAEGRIGLAIEITTLDSRQILYNGSGESLRELAITLTMPQTAVYLISVWDGSYGGENGSYEIRLER